MGVRLVLVGLAAGLGRWLLDLYLAAGAIPKGVGGASFLVRDGDGKVLLRWVGGESRHAWLKPEIDV